GQASLRVREAPEAHQLAHGEAGDEVVLLPQHREDLREVFRRDRGDVVAGHLDGALVDTQQTARHGQQGRLPGAVEPHQGGDAPVGELDGYRADFDRLRILLPHRVDGDHRRPHRMMTRRNTLPPTSSMMMDTTPWAANRWFMMKYAPESTTKPVSTPTGSSRRWSWVRASWKVSVATRNPKKVIGPTRAVETAIRIETSTSM